MNASLNEKLENVKWGEYQLQELFYISGTKSLDSNAIEFTRTGINFVGRTFENNGIQGKIQKREFEPNEPYTITATVIGNYKYVKYQKESYYCSQNINKLSPRPILERWHEKIAYFIIANVQKFVSLYDGQQGGYKLVDLKKHKIKLPIKNSKIDFDFMESFMTELEKDSMQKLSTYLTVSELDNYELSEEEEKAIDNYESLDWNSYNLEALFGKSTRGKRLKSEDRIKGTLPFVTAGEAEEGVSAFIGNKVDIFEKNTTTIDMFGSAKYRNFRYGADDHVAVVHTEDIPMKASIFVTSAIHKAAHTGQFDYGRNFYPKDADALDIMLPTKDGEPDYQVMALLISAIQKQVIKDVVKYSNAKVQVTKEDDSDE